MQPPILDEDWLSPEDDMGLNKLGIDWEYTDFTIIVLAKLLH